MNNLKIALAQCMFPGEIGAAFEKAENICRQAKDNAADIVLFPEMWSDGYAFFEPAEAGEYERWLASAIADDSRHIRGIAELARQLRLAVCITYLRKTDSDPENSLIVFDRNGDQVLRYSKVHVCSYELEKYCRAGTAFRVAMLDTAKGVVTIGAMICFDREFPESARVLGLMGAELVLVPNSCELDGHRIAQFKSRAFENKAAFAMTNYPAPKHNGRSIVVGNAFYNRDEEPLDPVILVAGSNEGVFYADVDIDEVRRYRNAAIWDPRYRQPQAYQTLCADVELPENDQFEPRIPKPKLKPQNVGQ